jgi:nucleoside-diphosphate-sugar epimerase
MQAQGEVAIALALTFSRQAAEPCRQQRPLEMQTMKILILGATGQVGHALTKGLSHTEHQVSVLVRDTSGLQFPDNVTVLERGDFTPDVFRAVLSGVDHVIYGIGLPEQFLFDNSVFDRVNCQLLRTFLETLRSSGVRRLTYISTYEVFEVIDNEIDETHPVGDESEMTPYFQSMVRAYRIAVDFAHANDIQLTTIHPAAVYGGRNTGGGITDYMENLASRNWHRLPFINPSSFPVVHVESLTDAITKSLELPGAYIVSDQMTSLKDIAESMRKQAWSYVPLMIPLWMIMIGIHLLEAIARIIRIKPFASSVQIAFLTKGWRPDPSKAIRELSWKPMPLEEGVKRFLAARRPSGGEAGYAVRGSERMRLIARLEQLTAAGLFLYWILYFTVGVAPVNPPPGYFVFQNSFTFADLILAVLLTRAAAFLLGGDPIRRVLGRGLSLICAGALLFLGGLDISFNFQNDIYSTLSIDMALEVAVNIWCLGFGFLLAYEFAFNAHQRH